MSGRRIAIVGAGISGLVAARQLHRAGDEVTVFEAGDQAGGHTNTIKVESETGAWQVDTGFIVFNDRNYPNFEQLLAELGVDSQPTDMSFSVSDGGGFEWASRPRGVFAQGSNLLDPRFHRMLVEFLRFRRDARGLIGTNGSGPTLRTFLEQRNYSDYFVERLIVPKMSAIWSADPGQLWSFPVSFLAEFLDNHGTLDLVGRPQWRSIPGGARRYVVALTALFRERLHLRTPVRSIRRGPRHVEVGLDAGTERFDEVVIAAHSNQALAMLADPSAAEHEVLGALPYQGNEAVLHSDANLLPRRRAAWASWNFHLTGEPHGRTTVTYHMNRLQSLVSDRELLVTLNRTDAIDPGRVIHRIPYSHPVYTAAGVAAQQRWAEISGHRHTHYCGAYWRWGFHEDGAWSGLRVAEALGAIERGRRILASPKRARAA